MKSCNDCAFAEWYRTAAGRLHPSGDGRCKKEIKIPALPQAFYWGPGGEKPPAPYGGFITRKEELDDHCVYYTFAPRTP